jgi:hypothetical protein
LYIFFLLAIGLIAGMYCYSYFRFHPIICILAGISAIGGTWLLLAFLPPNAAGATLAAALVIPLASSMRSSTDVLWLVAIGIIGFGAGRLFAEFAKGRKIHHW